MSVRVAPRRPASPAGERPAARTRRPSVTYIDAGSLEACLRDVLEHGGNGCRTLQMSADTQVGPVAAVLAQMLRQGVECAVVGVARRDAWEHAARALADDGAASPRSADASTSPASAEARRARRVSFLVAPASPSREGPSGFPPSPRHEHVVHASGAALHVFSPRGAARTGLADVRVLVLDGALPCELYAELVDPIASAGRCAMVWIAAPP